MRLSSVLISLLAVVQPAAAQVKLEWKFSAGESFVIERVYSQKQEVEIKGRSFKQETSSTWRTRVALKEKKLGNWVLLLTLEEVSYSSGGIGNPAVFDDKLVARMKGQSFTLTLAPDGAVKKLSGYEDFIKKLADGKAEVEKVLRTVLSEDGIKEGCEEMFAFLPRKSVAKGDKWKRETLDPLPPFGAFETRFDYTYAGVKEGLQAIEFTLHTKYQKPRADLELVRVIKAELSGEEGEGYYLIDATAGRLARGAKDMLVRGQVTLETGGVRTEMRFTSANRLTVKVLDGK